MPAAVGVNMLPLLADPSSTWRDNFLVNAGTGNGVPAHYSVHGTHGSGLQAAEYVYVQYSTAEEELYNLNMIHGSWSTRREIRCIRRSGRP